MLLNRPQQLNALSGELMEDLVAALQKLDEAETVRCIVLGGNERAFAAGADIAELAAGTPVSLYQVDASTGGTRFAACARRLSRPSPVTASAADASLRWRAT